MLGIMKDRPWIVAAVFGIALSIGLAYWFSLPKSRFDEKSVSAAEDQVYEAVVRDMVTPIHGQTNISQLAFDDTLLTEFTSGSDMNSCKVSARKSLHLGSSRLPYNSIVDKAYRLFTRGVDDASLRADTIQDFLEKSCSVGRLSETFHTDLPRRFIARDSVYFDVSPADPKSKQEFSRLFPGAPGLISFSHVGFDSTLREAIVSTAFVCGGLCGTGSRYVLKKIRGHWEVVNKWIVWVS